MTCQVKTNPQNYITVREALMIGSGITVLGNKKFSFPCTVAASRT